MLAPVEVDGRLAALHDSEYRQTRRTTSGTTMCGTMPPNRTAALSRDVGIIPS